MNFTQRWSAPEAVLNLYFSDDTAGRIGGKRRQWLEQEVRFALEGVPNPDRSIEPREREAIKQIVSALGLQKPEKKQAGWPGLLWVRRALHSASSPPLCTYALRCLSEWRADHPVPGMWVIRYKANAAKKSRRTSRRNALFGIVSGFTVDEFLLSRQLPGDTTPDTDPDAFGWQFEWLARLPQESDNKPLKPRQDRYADLKGMGLDCGSNALKEVIKCVTEAARSGQPFLTKNRTRLRFTCSMSRHGLAEWLRGEYGELQKYKINTVKRAISAIASCPKGNTQKSRQSI